MCMLATVNTGSARHCASSSLEIVLQIWNICFDPIELKANSRNSLNSSISTDITEGRGEREMFCIEKKMRTNKWNEIEFPVGLLCRTNSRVDKLHKHGIKTLGYWEIPDKKDDYRVTVQHVCSFLPTRYDLIRWVCLSTRVLIKNSEVLVWLITHSGTKICSPRWS